jgi:murein DD-endopeptidase MepM/ murein hydrolase activator NlpD
MDKAILEGRVRDLAGNYVVIKHNRDEFSHLFHLKQDSIKVRNGQGVERGDPIGTVGFSGAATTYSHLHYQLMDGADFLRDNPLPCRFSKVELLLGSVTREYDELSVDTGDILISR